MNNLKRLLLTCSAFLSFAYSAEALDKDTLDKAALIFVERCALCHGNVGMGEGLIPLKVGTYPSTNLYKGIKYPTKKEIKSVIVEGIPFNDPVRYMPPWVGELTDEEIDLLSEFVVYLREDQSRATALLQKAAESSHKSNRHGKQLYETRCVLCHGVEGKGDGRMSRIIKEPPPANFIVSTVEKPYIKAIIQYGGAELKRSPQMPPWGDQLTEREIDAIVDYVYGLRKK